MTRHGSGKWWNRAAVAIVSLAAAAPSIRGQEFKAVTPADYVQPLQQTSATVVADPTPAPTAPLALPPAAPMPELIPAPVPASPAAPSAPPVQANPIDPNSAAVRQIVNDYLAELESKKKAAEAQKGKESVDQWHEVGSDLNMRAKWVPGTGFVFSTPNEDWKIHVGGRFQFEPVFFQQPKYMEGTGTGSGGVPAATSLRNGGVGQLDDGAYFRRVRLRTDGVGYETIEFAMEVDFEQLNYITYDHLWFGAKDIPFLGTVRIGQHKVPYAMEGIGSDYHLTMLERSSAHDAFAVLFAPGIFWMNNYLNQNLVVQSMLHKTQPLGFYTSAFGDGNYATSTRVTGTPIYRDEGREIIHIGLSYQYRTSNLGRELQPGGTGNTFGDSQLVSRFRARPDLRDAIGIGSGNNLGGDASRFVDTGYILSKGIWSFVPEFLAIWGPFSVQSEAYFVNVNGVRTLYPPARQGTPVGSAYFWGGYVEASYFLTGEHRGYDRRLGMYDRPVLNKNSFFVRGDDGCLHWNWGAWQVGYRFSYLDLDSNGVAGGLLSQHSMGLNWYINDNTKIQFQYNISQREVVYPAASGTVHGYGFLAQWYF